MTLFEAESAYIEAKEEFLEARDKLRKAYEKCLDLLLIIRELKTKGRKG